MSKTNIKIAVGLVGHNEIERAVGLVGNPEVRRVLELNAWKIHTWAEFQFWKKHGRKWVAIAWAEKKATSRWLEQRLSDI